MRNTFILLLVFVLLASCSKDELCTTTITHFKLHTDVYVLVETYQSNTVPENYTENGIKHVFISQLNCD